jgi:hypothetical protein
MLSLRACFASVCLAALSQAALAAPVLFSGSLSAADPTYNRTLSGNLPLSLSAVGTAVSYDVYAFSVTASGSYVMETLSASFTSSTTDDTFITLYRDAFNPANALTNALQADDDSGPGSLSTITRGLNSGVDYFLVVTSFNNRQFGDYTGRFNTVAGNGQVVLQTTGNNVPEPSTLLLAPAALAALGLMRRRRQTA